MSDLPQFLCIGATKAGTSWLHKQLDEHPEVCMPVVKELHFFDSLHVDGQREWTDGQLERALRRAQRRLRERPASDERDAELAHIRAVINAPMFSLEWYRLLFQRPGCDGRVTGEITPAYAELPDAGIEHVSELLPGVKIIYIVRHPFDRALSHLRMIMHRREIAPDSPKVEDLIESIPALIDRGACETYLPRWRRFVPPERLLILPFGQIRTDPVSFMKTVESFLGVSHHPGADAGRQANATRSVEIPVHVAERLSARVQPTLDWLRAEFGEAFIEQTR